MDLPLKCECGQVTGAIYNASPKQDHHVVCMCIDCQTFAHFLKKQDTLLDQNGGTEVYQITPNKMVIEQGHEHLRLIQLSPNGTRRFYTECCRTPVANTVDAKTSFAGVSRRFIDIPDEQTEALLGPVLSHCMAKYGRGELPVNSHPGFPLKLLIKVMSKILLGKLLGHNNPNPLFDLTTGQSLCPTEVMDKSERARIIEKINAL